MFFLETTLPHQKTFNDQPPFPTILGPNILNNSFNVSALTAASKDHKPWLESLLHKTGAVLLRVFPVQNANDFNDVVEAFGFDELPYVGGAALRSNVVGRVYTANESPPDQKIPFHHEMTQIADFLDGTITKGVAAYQKNEKLSINEIKLTPQELAELIASIKSGTVSRIIGKEILLELMAKGGTVKGLIEAKDLVQATFFYLLTISRAYFITQMISDYLMSDVRLN